jgi:hypothetical protein
MVDTFDKLHGPLLHHRPNRYHTRHGNGDRVSSFDEAEQQRDGKLKTQLEPGLKLFASLRVHTDLASPSALPRRTSNTRRADRDRPRQAQAVLPSSLSHCAISSGVDGTGATIA